MKTRKLKCVITGRVLTATIDYYNKKLEKAGSESELQRTYICKEAKELLLKGLKVEEIRQKIGVEQNLPEIDKDIVDSIIKNEYGIIRNTMFSGLTSFTHQETDPDVVSFINNI
jgi:hypothetical protein